MMIKNNDGSKGTPLCNTFVKFKAYEKIWSLLPKSGLSVNEIKIIYIFNMQLEDAYEYYQHVSKVHNDDRIKTEWNLSVNLADQSNTTMLIKFTKNNIVEINNVIEKYFSDVKYGIS